MTNQPEPDTYVKDYVVKYYGHDAQKLEGKTKAYMGRHLGQEELEYCIEIPGSGREATNDRP